MVFKNKDPKVMEMYACLKTLTDEDRKALLNGVWVESRDSFDAKKRFG